ncbi:Bax inhibitor-1/YccA family protein [Candidatus Peregrinibacteria bacterium]|nr:Bax inhibitor-1/YccA family protein [Candidatus Peregrinibacteria bacterium]
MLDQYKQPEFVAPSTSLAPTFFGKVMTAFSMAVAVSVLGVWVSFTYFLEAFIATPALIWVAIIAEFALILTSRMWSKRKPLNYWLFSAFAFLTGVSITPILLVATVAGGIGIVIKALLATVLMFAAAGIIGWTTKKSLEGIGGFLMIALIGMVITGLIGLFIPWGNQFEMIYSGIGVILFAGYAVYDFNMLKKYPEDSYIDAAMHLYLDIFNLFIFILRLLLSNRN